MLKYFKITYKNNRELKCTFSPEGNILNTNLGIEIRQNSKVDFQIDYSGNNYFLIIETLATLKNIINAMYTPINEKQEYCNNYDINDINFCVDQLGDSVFSLEEGKGRQLEICYKYENSVSIDILKSRNTILFNNKTEIISMTVLPSNHRICMDFSLKINL